MLEYSRARVVPPDFSTRSVLERAVKAVPPRLPYAYVARPRLERRLEVSPPASVVVVHGPAGSGKSVLLSAWYGSRAGKRSWLTLDERDAEPLTFWTDMSYALRALLGSDEGSASSEEFEDASAGSVLDLVRELGARPSEPRYLMLDNAQVLNEGNAHDGLRQLVDALPPSVTLLIATRSRPDISLHRLRVEGRAVEIDARDLRFTVEETVRLLEHAEQSDVDAATLVERSDGWATGLMIEATAQGSPEEATRNVNDFLSAEVFFKQPDDVQRFLMESACLDYVGAALCRKVTGRADAADLLQRLEREAVFLSGVDGDFGRYAYHPQFRQLLRNELGARDPERADAVRVAGAQWCEEHDHLAEAIDQWLDAGRQSDALRLLRSANVRYGHTRPELVRNWAARIDASTGGERPPILIDLATSHALGGSDQRAGEVLDRADGLLPTVPDPVSEIRSAALRGRLAAGAADVESLVAIAQQGRSRLRSDPRLIHDPLLEGTPRGRRIDGWLALGQVWLEQLDDARTTLTTRPYAHLEDRTDLLHAWGVGAALSFAEGHLHEAGALARQSRGEAAELGIRGYSAWTSAVVLAAILHERDDDASALAAYEQLIEETREPAGNIYSIAAQVGLAGVLRTRGDTSQALEILLSLREDHPPHTRTTVQSWVDRATALTLLRLGQIRAARDALGPPPYRESETLAAALIELRAGNPNDASRLSASIGRETPRGLLFASLVDAQAAALRGDDAGAIVIADDAVRVAREHGFLRTVLDFGRELLPVFEATPTGMADPEFIGTLRDAARVTPAALAPREPDDGFSELSARELVVLRYLPTQLSVREIARALYVSPNTVKSHMQHLYRKLGVDSRDAAVELARTLHLLR